tara:strand:- start:43 stop:282 length:240 start_codon:yes stop_codon:yes gene_type:complete
MTDEEFLEQVRNSILIAHPMSGDNNRAKVITLLRSALNAAEGGCDDVLISWGSLDITWNFDDAEFSICRALVLDESEGV